MRKWMVLPDAPPGVLASFIAPYIPVTVIKGERDVVVVWYAGDDDMGEFRKRADEWEAEQLRKGSLPKGWELT